MGKKTAVPAAEYYDDKKNIGKNLFPKGELGLLLGRLRRVFSIF